MQQWLIWRAVLCKVYRLIVHVQMSTMSISTSGTSQLQLNIKPAFR